MRRIGYVDVSGELILAMLQKVRKDVIPKSAVLHKIVELDRQPNGPALLNTFRLFIEDESFGEMPEGAVYPRLD